MVSSSSWTSHVESGSGTSHTLFIAGFPMAYERMARNEDEHPCYTVIESRARIFFF